MAKVLIFFLALLCVPAWADESIPTDFNPSFPIFKNLDGNVLNIDLANWGNQAGVNAAAHVGASMAAPLLGEEIGGRKGLWIGGLSWAGLTLFQETLFHEPIKSYAGYPAEFRTDLLSRLAPTSLILLSDLVENSGDPRNHALARSIGKHTLRALATLAAGLASAELYDPSKLRAQFSLPVAGPGPIFNFQQADYALSRDAANTTLAIAVPLMGKKMAGRAGLWTASALWMGSSVARIAMSKPEKDEGSETRAFLITSLAPTVALLVVDLIQGSDGSRRSVDAVSSEDDRKRAESLAVIDAAIRRGIAKAERERAEAAAAAAEQTTP
ncbi:MAG: hypothetical protein HY075_11530 [Deltaproteobacteria bacterium]|nr:hypothetical protein [Deltaproteobacteria bacterium]